MFDLDGCEPRYCIASVRFEVLLVKYATCRENHDLRSHEDHSDADFRLSFHTRIDRSASARHLYLYGFSVHDIMNLFHKISRIKTEEESCSHQSCILHDILPSSGL